MVILVKNNITNQKLNLSKKIWREGGKGDVRQERQHQQMKHTLLLFERPASRCWGGKSQWEEGGEAVAIEVDAKAQRAEGEAEVVEEAKDAAPFRSSYETKPEKQRQK